MAQRLMDSPAPSRIPADVPAHGGINVCVRIRPLCKSEQKTYLNPAVVSDDGTTVKVNDPKKPQGSAPNRTYEFSQVFGPDSSQREVYDNAIAPVVHDVVNGYNCTVFAYGQTGTGKTYTMEGARSDRNLPWDEDPTGGMIPRAVHHLFDALHAAYQIDPAKPSVVLSVSYFELYNENVFDLLASPDNGSQRPSLQILEDPQKKGSVIVKGATKKLCKTKEEVIALLETGASARKKACTNLNNQSSRSHAIFMVTVYMSAEEADTRRAIRSGPKQHVRTGKLNLVDLAGSESIGRSGAKDAHAREAGSINKSLLNLKIVIDALVQSNTNSSVHIPYRGSKLTRLLQDSLGGKTKTTIIAAVSPVNDHLEETISTLDYACKAKAIVNRPEVSDKEWGKISIAEYVEKIERLRLDLKATQEKFGIYMPPDQYKSMQAASDQRLDEYIRKRDEFCAAQERKAHLDEVNRALEERLDQLTTLVDHREKVATEAEDFGKMVEEKHNICKTRGEEIVAVARKGLRDLNAVSDAAERMREVNTSNRRAYEEFLGDFQSAAFPVTEAADLFCLPSGHEEEDEELKRFLADLESDTGGILDELTDFCASAENEIMGSPNLDDLKMDTKEDIRKVHAWADKVEILNKNGWMGLEEVNDGRKVEDKKISLSLRTADAELDAGSSVEGTSRHAAETKLTELASLKTGQAAAIDERVVSGEKVLADAEKELHTILESLARVTKSLSEFDVNSTVASSTIETLAGKSSESHQEVEKLLSDGLDKRDVHFEKASAEFQAASSIVEARAGNVKQVYTGLAQQQKTELENAKKEVDSIVVAVDAGLVDQKNQVERMKQEAVDAFTCSEINRRVLQTNVEKRLKEAENLLNEIGASSVQFVEKMTQDWFQEAPAAAEEFCAVAESGTAEMAGAFDRLSNGDFVEYQSTGSTPARRGSGFGTPLRLPRYSTPSTPREAMLQRHREIIRNLEMAAIETPPDSSLSQISETSEEGENQENKENVEATPVGAAKPRPEPTSAASSVSSGYRRQNVGARK